MYVCVYLIYKYVYIYIYTLYMYTYTLSVLKRTLLSAHITSVFFKPLDRVKISTLMNMDKLVLYIYNYMYT